MITCFLSSDLHKSGIYACGTIRSNRRGFPPKLAPLLKQGLPHRSDSITFQSQKNPQLTVSVWQDNKPVTVSSTFCQTVPLDSVSRKLRNGQHSVFPCPEAITQYNHYMGGVDRNDQLRQYYHVHLKSRKFYKYIFWMSPSPTLTYYLLMLFPVAIQKTTGQCSRKKRGRKSSLSKKPFRSNHFPLKSDGKQHPCQYCKIYGITKDTTWHCQDCSTYVTR